MNTHSDDSFAHSLRALADDVTPDPAVHLDRVIPQARRMRRHRRLSVVAAVGVLALGTGWAAQAQPWSPAQLQPAGPGIDVGPASSQTPTPSDDASAAAAQSETTAAADAAAQAADDAATGWPDAPYWRTLTTITQQHSDGTTTTEGRESWYGRTDPGLIVVDGNLDPGSLGAFGPASWGRLDIDGVDTIIGWDALAALPADPAALDALLRANVQPDRDTGTPDDEVFKAALDLLAGSPAPTPLRDALWQLLTTLPGSTDAGVAQDSTGRAGVAVQRTIEGEVYTLVYDPATHRLLESSQDTSGNEGATTTLFRSTYLEEGPADAPPVEPTLEMAGCARWATC